MEALGRTVRLIPVLVEGAGMPRATELPEPLKPLALRNAFALHDEEWTSDVERLAAAIQSDAPVRASSPPGSRRPFVAAVAGAALLGALLATPYTRGARSLQQTAIPRPEPRRRPAAARPSPCRSIPTGRRCASEK